MTAGLVYHKTDRVIAKSQETRERILQAVQQLGLGALLAEDGQAVALSSGEYQRNDLLHGNPCSRDQALLACCT